MPLIGVERFRAIFGGKKQKKQDTVTFEYFAPQATQVQVAGSFNNWSASGAAMKKDGAGRWQLELELSPGRHEYRYIVDGRWQNEQKSCRTVRNPFGTYNAVIDVKGKAL